MACELSATRCDSTRSQSAFVPQERHCGQLLPLSRAVLALAASVIWLPKVLSALGGAFSCFGFLVSRLLRFCPLAMVESPFDEGGIVSGRHCANRLESDLRGHSFMTFVVIADAVLRRISQRWERSDDAINIRPQSRYSKAALETDKLADRKEMRGDLAADRAGCKAGGAGSGHGRL